MRDLEQARAEVFRRSEERIQERTRMRRRALTLCVPLVLCLVIGAVTAPALLRGDRSNTAAPAAPTAPAVQEGVDGAKNSTAQEYALSDADEASLLLQSFAPRDQEDGQKAVTLPGEMTTVHNSASPEEPSVVDETQDGAEDEYTGVTECRVTVNTPEGEVVYIIAGDTLKCETEGWERRLTTEEAEELYEALEMPADDCR